MTSKVNCWLLEYIVSSSCFVCSQCPAANLGCISPHKGDHGLDQSRPQSPMQGPQPAKHDSSHLQQPEMPPSILFLGVDKKSTLCTAEILMPTEMLFWIHLSTLAFTFPFHASLSSHSNEPPGVELLQTDDIFIVLIVPGRLKMGL